MATILCMDDDPDLTDLLRYGPEREGFGVALARMGHEGLCACPHPGHPARRTRAGDEDIIARLEGDADGYVATPFDVRVLGAHVAAELRRTGGERTARRRGRAAGRAVAGAVLDRGRTSGGRRRGRGCG